MGSIMYYLIQCTNLVNVIVTATPPNDQEWMVTRLSQSQQKRQNLAVFVQNNTLAHKMGELSLGLRKEGGVNVLVKG